MTPFTNLDSGLCILHLETNLEDVLKTIFKMTFLEKIVKS